MYLLLIASNSVGIYILNFPIELNDFVSWI